MIKLAYSLIPCGDEELNIKKISEALPAEFCERNSDYIETLMIRKNRPSALRSLVSLGLLLRLIPDAKNAKITRDELDRPYFENMKHIDFNISHSNDLAVCTVCCREKDTAPIIGVDCEKIEKKDMTAIVERFFAEGEKKQYTEAVDKKRAFTELWTKKEAYVKYLGTGIRTPFPSFDTTLPLSVEFKSLEKNGNIITVCAKKECFPLQIEEI